MRELREHSQLSRCAAARLAAIDYRTLTAWEEGTKEKDLRLNVFLRLAAVYGIEKERVLELLEDATTMPPQPLIVARGQA